MPTNIDFLSKLAHHFAFENGEVETHFIEQYKDDLFISAGIAQEACNAMRCGASIAAACICKMELAASSDSAPGKFKLGISGNLFLKFLQILDF